MIDQAIGDTRWPFVAVNSGRVSSGRLIRAAWRWHELPAHAAMETKAANRYFQHLREKRGEDGRRTI